MWIAENIGTIIVLAVLVAVVTFILKVMKKDKLAGKSSCGGGCANCAMQGKCHSKSLK